MITQDQSERRIRPRHTLTMDNRERLSLTGVNDVASFNEDEVLLTTEAGELSVCGENLHIAKLNLDDGQLVIEGQILLIEYVPDAPQKNGGFFSRVFR